MQMIANVKNESRALDFAKEILGDDIKKDINNFEIKIKKIKFYTFLITITKRGK